MLRRVSQRAVGFALIGLVFVASGAAYAYSSTVQQAEPRVFYDAIRANLLTEGITCTVSRSEAGNTSSQKISLDLPSKSDAHSWTTLSEKGATVVTEGLSTKQGEYVRYTSIKLSGQNAGGKTADFSKVLNVWGKQSGEELGRTPLFDQAALGGCIVPLASLSPDKVDSLMAEVEKGRIFAADFANVKRASVNGALTYAYTVTLTGPVYIKFLKSVADAAGLKGLQGVDEEAYAERAPEKLTFHVNTGTHRLERIEHAEIKQTTTFSDYGRRPQVTPPKNSVPTAELQERLAAVR